MRIIDIEPGAIYMGCGRHLREVVKFSENGNRVLYRVRSTVYQTGTKKIIREIGELAWMNIQGFAGWACREVEE